MKNKLLTIGEVAKETGEEIHTIRFWTQQELLTVAGTSKGGYQLYSPDVIQVVKKIRTLKDSEHYTLKGIRNKLAHEIAK